MGAICKFCKRDMIKSKGCKKLPVIHEGQTYNQIKVGGPGDWGAGKDPATYVCGHCAAKHGHYHHPGCDAEQCPVCGGQLISCGCTDTNEES